VDGQEPAKPGALSGRIAMLRFDKSFRDELSGNWRVLLVAFSCLFFGFSAPAFSLPFLFSEVIAEFGWTREQATLLASAKYLTGAVAALAVGRFVDLIGARWALLLTLTIGGGALVSFLWVSNLEIYYFVGIFLGLAGPGAMVAVKVLVSRTFHASQGTAMGIALLGTGLGAVLVPVMISFLISEFGWRIAFASLSAGIWLITLPLLLFFSTTPKSGVVNAATRPATGADGGSLREALALAKHHPFWLLAGGLFLAATVDQGFVQHQVLILNDLNMSRESAALAVSGIGMVGIVARILVGNILDSGSNRGLSVLYLALTVSSLLAFYLVSPMALLAFVFLRALGHSTVLIDNTVLAKHVFGLKNFGTVVGVYVAIVSLGFATGPWVMGRIFDMTGSYDAAFILFAILPLVAALFVWFLKPTHWLAAREARRAGEEANAAHAAAPLP
jgi:MFS family permease